MRKIGIIAGTGMYDPLEQLAQKGMEEKIIITPFGPTKCKVGKIFGNFVVIITRHGIGHSVPPHMINYRANIWALKDLGVEEIFATTAVGSCNPSMKPGHFVVCNQILDFTKNRVDSFFDGQGGLVAHVDFTNPYCSVLREKVMHCLKKLDFEFHATGCYVCTEGPRFETAAEVRMFAQLGGDVIGMTNMPEALLAREAEICYVNCSTVVNMGAGIQKEPLSHIQILNATKDNYKKMGEIITEYVRFKGKTKSTCNCHNALKEFGGFNKNLFVL